MRTRGQRFDIDCERFRAQLLHLMRVYGWNANTLGQAVIGHPSRVYRYTPVMKLHDVSGAVRVGWIPRTGIQDPFAMVILPSTGDG